MASFEFTLQFFMLLFLCHLIFSMANLHIRKNMILRSNHRSQGSSLIFYSRIFSKIVLQWKVTNKGIQFNRIFRVWLSGFELLRSCTAEPMPDKIVWTSSMFDMLWRPSQEAIPATIHFW
ncbi:hypothetical protein HRI_000025700 [Hibiscus trionum]|uniref:Peptide N-acetyl-beta-D-glucosaminyl asparaginase amidase A N-terminal domain-containing protein n=1 Tax=Hibiscus trionum TaxID=183268 RepID=A0A9W7GPV3_HIBTR|nr:hypothetical protein HRI_000025700 [Hibiscus trionum]